MTDAPPPFEDDPLSDTSPVEESIPLARPIDYMENGVACTLPPTTPGDPLLLPGSTRLAALADVGVMVGAVAALEIVAGGALLLFLAPEAFFSGEPDSETMQKVFISGVVVHGLGWPILVIAAIMVRRQPSRSIGLRQESWLMNCVLGVAAVPAIYGLILPTVLILSMLSPSFARQMVENADVMKDLLPQMSPAITGLLMVAVGISEEMLFRGFFMTRLRRWTESWTLAVLLSAGVFTALHAFVQTPAAMVIIGILSLVFSGLTIWRRSIIPAIVAHALFNFSQFVGIYYL